MDEELNKIAELFPDSVELSKGIKGGYGWTIKVRFKPDTSAEDKVKTLETIDVLLKEKFGSS